MNELLERVEGETKAEFSVGLIGVFDVAAGRVDDIAAMWNVRVARKAAWTNAEVDGRSGVRRTFAARSSTHSTDPQD